MEGTRREDIRRSTLLLQDKRAGRLRQTVGRAGYPWTETPEKVISTCPRTGSPKTRAGS